MTKAQLRKQFREYQQAGMILIGTKDPKVFWSLCLKWVEFLYRKACAIPSTSMRFHHPTPEEWVEAGRNAVAELNAIAELEDRECGFLT